MVEEVDKAVDMIAHTQILVDELKKENARHEENIKRMEAMESRRILGGQSIATPPAAEKKEETPLEYAKRMLRGGV